LKQPKKYDQSIVTFIVIELRELVHGIEKSVTCFGILRGEQPSLQVRVRVRVRVRVG
jgi:hypothetical protein